MFENQEKPKFKKVLCEICNHFKSPVHECEWCYKQERTKIEEERKRLRQEQENNLIRLAEEQYKATHND